MKQVTSGKKFWGWLNNARRTYHCKRDEISPFYRTPPVKSSSAVCPIGAGHLARAFYLYAPNKEVEVIKKIEKKPAREWDWDTHFILSTKRNYT